MDNLFTYLMPILVTETMDSTNYILAKYILNNVYQLRDVSSASLAKACNVSKASVTRFCHRIGIDDFYVLKHLIKTYQSDEYVMSIPNEIQFLSELSQAFLNPLTYVEWEQFIDLAKDIKRFERVILMGDQQSFATTIMLQNVLSNFSKIVEVVGEPTIQKRCLEDATKKDLIIVFSMNGTFFDRFGRKKICQGTPRVYLITTNQSVSWPFVTKKLILAKKSLYMDPILAHIYALLIGIAYKQIAARNDN